MKQTIKEKDVKISTGMVHLIKPKAGARNKALIEGEFPSPNSPAGSYLKWSVVWINLLPSAIDNTKSSGLNDVVPISQQLDNLSQEDYDLLQTGLKEFYVDDTDMKAELQGESQGQSEQKDSQKADGSKTSSSSTTSAKSSASAPAK